MYVISYCIIFICILYYIILYRYIYIYIYCMCLHYVISCDTTLYHLTLNYIIVYHPYVVIICHCVTPMVYHSIVHCINSTLYHIITYIICVLTLYYILIIIILTYIVAHHIIRPSSAACPWRGRCPRWAGPPWSQEKACVCVYIHIYIYIYIL